MVLGKLKPRGRI